MAILEENLLEAAEDLRLSWRFSFKQDKDPKLKARVNTEWFKSKHIYMYVRVAQSKFRCKCN